MFTDQIPSYCLCKTSHNKVNSVLTLVLPAQGHCQDHTKAGEIKPPNLLYDTTDTYWYMYALPTTTLSKSERQYSSFVRQGSEKSLQTKIEFNKNNFAHIPKTLIYWNDLFMGLFAKCGAITEYVWIRVLIETGRPESSGLRVMVGGRLWSLAYTTHSGLVWL